MNGRQVAGKVVPAGSAASGGVERNGRQAELQGGDVSRDAPILGVQVGINSGCALYWRGEIVFAVNEERFTKCKNETLYPRNAIDAALRYVRERKLPDPKTAVLPTLNQDYQHYAVRREATFSVEDYIREQHDFYRPRIYEKANTSFIEVFADRVSPDALNSDELRALKGSPNPQELWRSKRGAMIREHTGITDIQFVNHERSHAAYAFYASGVSAAETLVVTVDGFGDESNCAIWTVGESGLSCHRRYSDFNIGRLYRFMTLLLGMKPNEHEYKVMGLAPFATEEHLAKSYAVFAKTMRVSDGEITSEEAPSDYYFFFRDKLEGHRFDAIAGGLQRHVETVLSDLVRYWIKELGRQRVVLSGGVSLNIKANLVLSEMPEIDEVFVPAAGGDESLCIGGIFSYLDSLGRASEILPVTSMYLGDEFSQDDVDLAIEAFVEKHPEFALVKRVGARHVARLLDRGYVIGRFCGRMEFGPRSLGNRAILANPGDSRTVERINRQIKRRDFWMPFTPSILDKCADEYLLNEKRLRFPFMTVACHTSAAGQSRLAAALHPADRTARPQVVTRQDNPDYYELLEEFYLLTGTGGLLNTSLNLSGRPICQCPEDVFSVLLGSNLDMAVLGTTLVHRPDRLQDLS